MVICRYRVSPGARGNQESGYKLVGRWRVPEERVSSDELSQVAWRLRLVQALYSRELSSKSTACFSRGLWHVSEIEAAVERCYHRAGGVGSIV
jgi:hypothetical protein